MTFTFTVSHSVFPQTQLAEFGCLLQVDRYFLHLVLSQDVMITCSSHDIMTSVLPKVMDSSLFLFFDILIASDELPTLSSLVSTSLKSQLSSYLPGDFSLSPFSLSHL